MSSVALQTAAAAATATHNSSSVVTTDTRSSRQRHGQSDDGGESFNAVAVQDGEKSSKCYDIASSATPSTVAATVHMNTNAPRNNSSTTPRNDDKNQQQCKNVPPSTNSPYLPPSSQSSLSSFEHSKKTGNDVFILPATSHVPYCDAFVSSQSHYQQPHLSSSSYQNSAALTTLSTTDDDDSSSFKQQKHNDSYCVKEAFANPEQNQRRSSSIASLASTGRKFVAAEQLPKISLATEQFTNRLLQSGSKRASSILNFLSTHTVGGAAASQQQPTSAYNRTASSSNVYAQNGHQTATTLSSTPSSPAKLVNRRPRTASSANVAAVGSICRRAVESVTEKLYSAYLQQQQQTGAANPKRAIPKQANTTDITAGASSSPMHSDRGEAVLLPNNNNNNYHNNTLNPTCVQTTNLGMSASPKLSSHTTAATAASTSSKEAKHVFSPAKLDVQKSVENSYQTTTSAFTYQSTAITSSISSEIRPGLLCSTTVEQQPPQQQQQQLSSTSSPSPYYPGSVQVMATSVTAVCHAANISTPMTAAKLTQRHAVVGSSPSPAVSSRTLPLSPNNSVDKPHIMSLRTYQQHGRTDTYEDDDDMGLPNDRKSSHLNSEVSTTLASLTSSISAILSTANANSVNSATGGGSTSRRNQHFLTISAFPSPPSSKVPSQSDFYQTMQAAANSSANSTVQSLNNQSENIGASVHLPSSLSYNDSFRLPSFQDCGSSIAHQQQGPPALTVAAPAGVITLPGNSNLPPIMCVTSSDIQYNENTSSSLDDLGGPVSDKITSSISTSNISSVINEMSLSFASHRPLAPTQSTPPAFVVGDAGDAPSSDTTSSLWLRTQIQSSTNSSSSVNNLRMLGIGCAGSTLGPPSINSGSLSPKLSHPRKSLNVTSSPNKNNTLSLTGTSSSPASQRRRASAIAQNMMVLQASGAVLVRSKLLASAIAGQTVPINDQQQTLHNYKPSSAMADISTASMPTAKTATGVQASVKQAEDEQAAALQRPKPLPLAVTGNRAMSSATAQTVVVKSNSIDVTRRGMRYALHHQSFVKHGEEANRAAAVARDARDRAKDQAQKIPHLKALQASDDNTYRQLGTYKVGNATLGHGTYSIVKLAYNEEDHNHYAMKILSKKKLTKKFRMQRKATGDPLQDVRREIAILRKVNHPNIIKLMEVLDEPSEDYLYLVFELLEREVIEIPTQNPLSEDEAWAYFREVVRGVEYLHHYRIVHRDLKPSNLLLSDSGELKIADFGLSDEFEGVDASLSGTVGTPAFTAPECLNPAIKSYSGRAIDIWCMGITLYCFVVGEVPFKDDFLLMLYNKIRHNQPEFPATLSENLKDLILRMLEKNAEQRITLEQIKNHPWVTKGDLFPMLTEEENCNPAIYISNYDIETSVKTIPSLSTLILVKHMIKRASFSHPFRSASTCT